MTSNPTSKKAVVYISLDCLLDTRLGVLAKEDPELAKKALAIGTYHSRDIDAFPGVSHERFKELYKNRDADVLPLSVFTNIVAVLQSCVKGSLDDFALGGQNEGVQFLINLHPYQLDEETANEIAKAVAHHTFRAANVEIAKIPDEFLTPSYCKQNYAMMIMYSIDEWVTLHAEAFKETKMPSVAVLTPALYEKIPTDEEFEELKKQNTHPFRTAEISLAPLFSLRFLDASMFSINNGIKPRRTKSPGPDAGAEVITPQTSA